MPSRPGRSELLQITWHHDRFRAPSRFLRGPSQVLPSLADSDVILERRDEENLVLDAGGAVRSRCDGTTHRGALFSDPGPPSMGLGRGGASRGTAVVNLAARSGATGLCARTACRPRRRGRHRTTTTTPFARNLASWRSTAEVWSDRRWPVSCKGRSTATAPSSTDRRQRERPRRRNSTTEPMARPRRRSTGLPGLAAVADRGPDNLDRAWLPSRVIPATSTSASIHSKEHSAWSKWAGLPLSNGSTKSPAAVESGTRSRTTTERSDHTSWYRSP